MGTLRYGAFFLFFILHTSGVMYAQTSGSVTKGKGTITLANLMSSCPSNHVTPMGTITSSDNKTWVVPADNNFIGGTRLTDLHNQCNNFTPGSLSAVNTSGVPVHVIDAGGDTVLGYIFADNYFELYINGILIGVDPVPYTPFNSCIVKFKVSKPYTIAVRLIDWEENVGLGSEIQGSNLYYPGDGGFIAQFSDGTVTDASWKVQSFYIAPIQDLNTVVEKPDGTHSTATATTTPTCNENCFGIHYDVPSSWNTPGFSDSGWPNASIYTAAQVTNQAAYTNFATTAWNKASFIWSSNLILDNLVLARKTVTKTNGINSIQPIKSLQFSNPFHSCLSFIPNDEMIGTTIVLHDIMGRELDRWQIENAGAGIKTELPLHTPLPEGSYWVTVTSSDYTYKAHLIYN